jgi:hypothetical protein
MARPTIVNVLETVNERELMTNKTSNNLEQGQCPIYAGISIVYAESGAKPRTHKRKGASIKGRP